MVKIQCRETKGRGGSKVARRETEGMQERLLVRAGFEQTIIEPQLLGFSDTPGRHRFAADTVFELDFALRHEYAQSLLSEHCGQTCAAESTTNRDHIVVIFRHNLAPAQ